MRSFFQFFWSDTKISWQCPFNTGLTVIFCLHYRILDSNFGSQYLLKIYLIPHRLWTVLCQKKRALVLNMAWVSRTPTTWSSGKHSSETSSMGRRSLSTRTSQGERVSTYLLLRVSVDADPLRGRGWVHTCIYLLLHVSVDAGDYGGNKWKMRRNRHILAGKTLLAVIYGVLYGGKFMSLSCIIRTKASHRPRITNVAYRRG